MMMCYCILLLLFNCSRHTYGSCPYMENALDRGKRLFDDNLKNNMELRHDNFLVGPTQPGYALFVEYNFPNNIINLMYNSSIMLLADEYYEQYLTNATGQFISIDEKLRQIELSSNCVPQMNRCRTKPQCNRNAKYRTMDGSCNNLERPNQGAAFSQYIRLLPPNYYDGIHEERKNVLTNEPLPSPRIIGNILYNQTAYPNHVRQLFNMGGLLWGQMLGHDIGNVVNKGSEYSGGVTRCCSIDYQHTLPDHVQNDACHSIIVPNNDPYYSKYNIRCLNYIRAQTAHYDDCKLGPAIQMTISSSYLDASQIYGRDDAVAATLRSFNGGRLRMDANDLLPMVSNCTSVLVADPRQLTTSILLQETTIFVRFHNYLAAELVALHSDWTDEKLYQEARRIFIAIYQHIITDDWARIILGDEIVDEYFNCENGQRQCKSYNERMIGGALTDFSSGALRYLHALLPNTFNLQSNATHSFKTLAFSQLMNNAEILQTDFLPVLRGAMYQSVWLGNYPEQIRNHAFPSADGIGADLASIDISRSRDFGVQPYYKYVEYCQPNGPKIESWNDLLPNIAAENITSLMAAYDHVHDVDLIVGMFAERKVGNGYLGAIGTCLFVEQLRRLIVTDRFFYNLHDTSNPFTDEQLAMIESVDYAKILCQVTDIEEIPQNALLMPSETNPIVQCTKIPKVNINAWRY